MYIPVEQKSILGTSTVVVTTSINSSSICKRKNTVHGTIPLLRHYNACYKIQLTLVSDTIIAASDNKRYNAAKAVLLHTLYFWYRTRTTLVSDTNIAASYNKRYNATKAVLLDAMPLVLHAINSGMKYQKPLYYIHWIIIPSLMC
jgi:hypothetical protein